MEVQQELQGSARHSPYLKLACHDPQTHSELSSLGRACFWPRGAVRTKHLSVGLAVTADPWGERPLTLTGPRFSSQTAQGSRACQLRVQNTLHALSRYRKHSSAEGTYGRCKYLCIPYVRSRVGFSHNALTSLVGLHLSRHSKGSMRTLKLSLLIENSARTPKGHACVALSPCTFNVTRRN